MARDDLLWVAVKGLGLYFILQGVQGTISMLIAGASGNAVILQLVVTLIIGAYLFLGGGSIVRLAGGRP